MAEASPRPRTRLSPYANLARGVFFVVVFGCGLAGLRAGVSLSEREIDGTGLAGFAAHAYYTLSLFVFGGVDLGTPAGGPAWAQILVWLAYFFAPAITVSAVVEAGLRLLNPHHRRMRRIRDHVIVCGGGQLGRLYVRELRAHDPRVPIVVIERDPNKATLRELRDVHGVEIVIGDVVSDELLGHAHVDRARQVMLLTGDDFSNLDAAARLVTQQPRLRGHVVAHVADLEFRQAIGSGGSGGGYETYNSLESAAVHLVETRLSAAFQTTKHRDLVVFAGFGRFGQTVLRQLRERIDEAFGTVIVLDLDAETHARRFAEGPGFGDREHHVVAGHLRDIAVWQQIHACIDELSDGPPVIVVGTGDEGTNLQTALDLRRRYPEAHITVRSFAASPFASEVAAQLDIEPLVLSEWIAQSMPRRWLEGS